LYKTKIDIQISLTAAAQMLAANTIYLVAGTGSNIADHQLQFLKHKRPACGTEIITPTPKGTLSTRGQSLQIRR
jgi:hypothetical protein